MEEPDYLDIDGRQLRILLTIRQAGSLSGAARMLGMNQSTVSYWLDLLRKRLDDPLFVRSGNGVAPTERAKGLFATAQDALALLEALSQREAYAPAGDGGALRVAATAVERDVILGPLLRAAADLAPRLTVDVRPTGSASRLADRLRQGAVDFAIVPEGSIEGEGIMQRRLFRIEDAVFFDPAVPLEEGDLDAYCARPQARVAFGAEAGFAIDRRLARLGRTRHVALQVANFDSALRLIRGTPIIATLPRPLARGTGQGLGTVAPPWAQDGLSFALYWHARNQTSARHAFWRERLAEIAKAA